MITARIEKVMSIWFDEMERIGYLAAKWAALIIILVYLLLYYMGVL